MFRTGIWREFPLLGLNVDGRKHCPRTWQLLTEDGASTTCYFCRWSPTHCSLHSWIHRLLDVKMPDSKSRQIPYLAVQYASGTLPWGKVPQLKIHHPSFLGSCVMSLFSDSPAAQVEAIASHWQLYPNEETALFSRLSVEKWKTMENRKRMR